MDETLPSRSFVDKITKRDLFIDINAAAIRQHETTFPPGVRAYFLCSSPVKFSSFSPGGILLVAALSTIVVG